MQNQMERIYRLDKLVLKITRADRLLGNVTSNTLDADRNALLDRFGKIIVTFEQFRKGEEFFIIINPKFYGRLMAAIEKYMKLVKAEAGKTKLKVYFDLDGKIREGIAIPQKKGQLVITEKELETTVSDEEFTLFRLKNNIPLHGIDYDSEMLLNVSEDYVSYQKGCFVGQEIIARVHHKSRPPKKLAVAADSVDMTSRVKDPRTGKELGFAFAENK
ncbi:Folate-dependent protein for Fe/S cluster synthesis/repair in oxidative stress [archaeon GW2011_AR15]|nr:Folate-dependent protein for Fe/S cluster synthesis/repair in oxidative stress [archaeon GW2011_AR15]MBS3104104.1 hypothetical protein [Candidatus Woesearchaeota archaeon]